MRVTHVRTAANENRSEVRVNTLINYFFLNWSIKSCNHAGSLVGEVKNLSMFNQLFFLKLEQF